MHLFIFGSLGCPPGDPTIIIHEQRRYPGRVSGVYPPTLPDPTRPRGYSQGTPTIPPGYTQNTHRILAAYPQDAPRIHPEPRRIPPGTPLEPPGYSHGGEGMCVCVCGAVSLPCLDCVWSAAVWHAHHIMSHTPVNRDLYHQPRGWATCVGPKNKTQGLSSNAVLDSGPET